MSLIACLRQTSMDEKIRHLVVPSNQKDGLDGLAKVRQCIGQKRLLQVSSRSEGHIRGSQLFLRITVSDKAGNHGMSTSGWQLPLLRRP